jgi:hypothetical protein
MHLYEVNPVDRMPIHVVARSPQEAVDLFVTWSAARGRLQPAFDMDQVSVENLRPEQQEQVRRAFAAGLVGIAHFDEEIGWTFTPPMWVPLAPDEHVSTAVGGEPLCVFQMREPSVPLEAFVLAPDQERAAALFELYVRAYDGDPDTLLWREWRVDQLDEPERSLIDQALALRREGLLTPDILGRWAFITPLGDH